MPDAVLADPGLPGDLGDGQDLGQRQEVGFHQQGKATMELGPRHLDGPDRPRGSLDAWDPRSDRGPVFEEPKVFPTALDGVVDRTRLAGPGILEAGAALEIDDQFEDLGRRVQVARNHFPRGCQAQGLGEEMFN